MLEEKDLKQIKAQGLTLNEIIKQLETFTIGIPFVNVVTTATINNGIFKLSQSEQEKMERYYETTKTNKEIVKFVPASGAATRMFKFLYDFLGEYNPEKQTYRSYVKEHKSIQLERFFDHVNEFAFINSVRSKIRILFPEYKKSLKGHRNHYFVRALLEEEGLNFGNLPKGLIPFHKYHKYSITAFEEQLYESAFYAASKNDAFLHFTFSEQHVNQFKKEFLSIKNRVSKKTKHNFHISYSFQNKSTDTIAVGLDNMPLRNDKGKLVFRPSGHGALLENLNDIDADLVFIKNIDNVTVRENVETVSYYKRVLAGKLCWLQNEIFGFLRSLDNDSPSQELIKEIHAFVWNELNIKDLPSSVSDLKELLNRPLRVCGVVENTGAPGGGPFWVKNEAGNTTLQIVETSQINLDDPHQKSILEEATHFNPVDLVCGLRDYKGNKFDLKKYADFNSGFITKKFENGEPIRALEKPGLWNGSMAYWLTVFVEVPLITFNPVKTVNDLLKKEHRPNA